ncbi:GNAT family N-acetyltransferase [Paenibacillus sp. JSM ZJ436]|uniref:GNAT family N-acetyltransferase n=1 Tax=Paenibacillus sp. JSM ZJ436 TaxID=3376190 RepID=UPI0037AF05EA
MITIRSAEIEDISQIQRIAREAWLHTYKELYSPSFIDHFLRHAYAEDSLRRSLEKDKQQELPGFLVAELDHQLAGFAQRRQLQEGEHEILRMYVLPRYHQRGIGRAFLRQYTHDLKSGVLIAWVAKENRIAIPFYEKSGFYAAEEKHEMLEGQSKTQVKYVLKL